MNIEEIESIYSELIRILRERQLDWVIKEVEEQLRFGKTERKQIETLRELQSDSGSFSQLSFKRGPKASFASTREYKPQERLCLLIDAIEQAIVNTAEMESAIADSLHELDCPFEGSLIRAELENKPIKVNQASSKNRQVGALKLRDLLTELKRET